jgi:L-amino acid N-acyltransferase YncA
MVDILLRKSEEKDIRSIMKIWNDCSAEGESFYWDHDFSEELITSIIKEQDYVSVAQIENKVIGFYILHKNNSGRGNHIANALYAIDKDYRSNGIGKKLGIDSIEKARQLGYKGLIFNSVVKTNEKSVRLWKSLDFKIIGEIPKAFRKNNNTYESILIMYRDL